MLIKKIIFTKINLINFLISFFPLSLIIGNLAININIVLVCALGLPIYGMKILQVNKKIYQYLIYSFFLYIILITLVKNLPNLNVSDLYQEHIIKSFLFLRFLILFLVINKLFEKNEFNLKLFFASCAFFSFIVSIDILIQLVFGQDLIGNTGIDNHLSGFFGDELIAGGYVQKFSLFFIFFIFVNFFNNNNFNTKFYQISLFFIFLIIVILTGNRMSVLLYLFSIFAFFLMEKKFKEILILITLFSALIFLSLKYFLIVDPQSINSRFDHRVKNFYGSTVDIFLKAPKLFYFNSIDDEEITEVVPGYSVHSLGSSGYLIHLNSGVQVFKKNKIFGGGLKSFRLNCKYGKNQTCNTHPHNYLIEILVDTGILGLTLIYLIFISAAVNFIRLYNQNLNSHYRFLGVPFFLIIFFEFFPLRSTGSFFTTGVAVIIFLSLPILINASKFILPKKL